MSKGSRFTLAGLAVCLLSVALAGAATGPPLVDAVRSGDADALRALLDQGVDVNLTEADGTTALAWASYRDDIESADLLIRAGADANLANDLGATALWAASQNGSETMVGRLLEAGADPNAALMVGETPVMVAARSGYPDVVEQLISAGADPDARAARDQTALMWAAAQNHPDVVEVLIEHGADVHARSEVWSQLMAVPPHSYYNRDIPHGGDTALMFAARSSDLTSARLLVAGGANVDDADAWGVSATSLAAHAGSVRIVQFLLETGADPNVSRPGFTALHNAVMRRDEQMVGALLDHGADPNEPLRVWTPTRRAADDFNFSPDLIGASPFWLAARFSTPAVMRLLVQAGADPLSVHEGTSATTSVADEFRTNITTALMASVGMGRGRAWFEPERSEREALTLEAAELLVDLGVDINAANTDGRTALDAATNLDYETVVEFLVENGAERGTPLDENP